MFIGRNSELSELNSIYQKNGFRVVVIYGRRRVGKTALINEFCKDKEPIFYIAIEQNDKAALESFSNVDLIRKSMIFSQYKHKTYILFSKAGYTKEIMNKAQEMYNIKLISANMLYTTPFI